MTGKLLDYLREYKDESFQTKPFSSVDALLLCNVSYFEFTDILSPDGPAMTFKQIDAAADMNSRFDSNPYGTFYKEMFTIMKDSPRYRHIRYGYFRTVVDDIQEKQFAALTCFIGRDRAFIAFRGTDGSNTGWKEDFNYAYLPVMPSQEEAVLYFSEIASKVKRKLFVGGHSKGGSQAVYAAALADPDVQDRILQVYSFDGVGFKPAFYEYPGFQRIRSRVRKIVPEESLIGRLFSIEPGFRIVKSYSKGLSQHDGLNWMIENGRLVFVRTFTKRQDRITDKINNWIRKLDPEQRKEFIDILFELIGTTAVECFDALIFEPARCIRPLIKGIFTMKDSKRRKMLLAGIRLLTA